LIRGKEAGAGKEREVTMSMHRGRTGLEERQNNKKRRDIKENHSSWEE